MLHLSAVSQTLRTDLLIARMSAFPRRCHPDFEMPHCLLYFAERGSGPRWSLSLSKSHKSVFWKARPLIPYKGAVSQSLTYSIVRSRALTPLCSQVVTHSPPEWSTFGYGLAYERFTFAGQTLIGINELLDYFFTPKIPSFAALATRNLTTVLAGILIFCCVFGLKPVRAFLFCFTSLPKPGKTNSPVFLISL
jgi:hypothetical protein